MDSYGYELSGYRQSFVESQQDCLLLWSYLYWDRLDLLCPEQEVLLEARRRERLRLHAKGGFRVTHTIKIEFESFDTSLTRCTLQFARLLFVQIALEDSLQPLITAGQEHHISCGYGGSSGMPKKQKQISIYTLSQSKCLGRVCTLQSSLNPRSHSLAIPGLVSLLKRSTAILQG